MKLAHIGTLLQIEGITQVFHAFLPPEVGLRGGVTGSPQGGQEREVALLAKERGENFRLIKTAIALPGGMKRYRDDRVKRELPRHAPPPFQKPCGQGVAEVKAAFVLKGMDCLTHDAVKTAGGNSGIKGRG